MKAGVGEKASNRKYRQFRLLNTFVHRNRKLQRYFIGARNALFQGSRIVESAKENMMVIIAQHCIGEPNK